MHFPPKMPSMGDVDNMLGKVIPHHGTSAEMHGKAKKAVDGGTDMVSAQEQVLKNKIAHNGDIAEAHAKGEQTAKAGKGAVGEAKGKVHGGGAALDQKQEQIAKRAGHGNAAEAHSKLAHGVQGNPKGNIAEAAGKGGEVAGKGGEAAKKAASHGHHAAQQVASVGSSVVNKLKHLF